MFTKNSSAHSPTNGNSHRPLAALLALGMLGATTMVSAQPLTECPADAGPVSSLGTLVDDARNVAAKAQLERLLSTNASTPAERAAVDAQVYGTLASLKADGRLEPLVTKLVTEAGARGALPPMSPEEQAQLAPQFMGIIDAELCARGLSAQCAGRVYESWDDLAARLLGQVRDTVAPAAGPGNPSRFLDPVFVAELEALSGAKFTEGCRVDPLIDGPASFAARDAGIDSATKSIHVMSWAFYDDETGWGTARKLVAKAAAGLDVKVIVDAQVATGVAHDETIAFMEANGVQVIRWTGTDRPYDGQHRKITIYDGKTAIAGGLNYGDLYSHRGPAGTQKWRDTDVLLEGRCATAGARLFADVWNQQVKSRALPLAKVALPDARLGRAAGKARVAVVGHTPGRDSHVVLSVLKAIEGATTTLDIENAYVISTPDLRDALKAAIARGVRVRILTNSAESVDVPLVSVPILQSLPELIDAGGEVYLKKGHTLHSKFLVVDGVFSQVGSHNLHPQGERSQGEMVVNILDSETARSLTGTFEADIAAARRIAKSSDLVIPTSTLSTLASRFFFDQL